MAVSCRRALWTALLAAAAGAGHAAAAEEDLEAYLQTREARITYSFAHRVGLEGQLAGHGKDDPYLLLAGVLEPVTPRAQEGAPYDPAFGREAIVAAAEAMLADPQTVTLGLGRALMAAGLELYLEGYEVYGQWSRGTPLAAGDQARVLRAERALEKVRLGRALLSEARASAQAPEGWEERVAPLRSRLAALRGPLAEADVMEAMALLRPLIEEAAAGLEDYPPYRRHRDELATWLADGTRAMGNAIARIHARAMGPGANMRRTNFYRGRGVRQLNEVWWTHDAGDPVRGQPAVGADAIFLAAAGRYRWDPLIVRGLELPGRETRWRFEAPARRGYSVTLYGNRLLVACGDVGAAPSYLCCLDAATGELRWVFEGPRGEDNTLSHPAVEEGFVYVADRWGGLFALDAATGAERWKIEAEPGRRASAPTPALAGGVVYLPAIHHVLAVAAADGRELWRLEAAVGEGGVAVEGEVLYLCQSGLAAVSLEDRRRLWSYDPPGASPLRGGPAVAAGAVFARDGSSLYAAEQRTGLPRWTFRSPRPFDWKVSPVVADGVVYLGTEGAQAGGAGDGAHLLAIDALTGKVLWQFQVETSLYGAPPVIADGVVYVSSGPLLYALR